ncbi:MAG: ATP-binding cassette domain-containing protein [Candidatus Hodarchaeota archaeon]
MSEVASEVSVEETASVVLQVENLTKSFRTVKAVNDLSFKIKSGEVFGLLGPNGSGKTTTVKLILGLLEPDRGEISLLGMHPERDEVTIKKRVGYVSEEPLIYKSLTPRELFNFIVSIRNINGEQLEKKLAGYLESLNAVEYYDRLIATLSHGNKQKMQIIAALLHDPTLLIMDEPLAGLDARSVKIVKEILNMHTERGGSVMFSTHIMEIAQDLCDRIAIINEGKLVGLGTFEELSKLADKAGGSLEEVFLKLTEQDEPVHRVVQNLRRGTINGDHAACDHCSAPITPGHKFCQNCGEKTGLV